MFYSLKILTFALLQFILLAKIHLYYAQDAPTPEVNKVYCDLCIEVATNILNGLAAKYNDTMLAMGAIQQCVTLNIQPQYVCEEFVMKNLDIASFILRNKPGLTPQHICSVLFQGPGCPRNESDNPVISLKIDKNRPKLNSSKNNIPKCKNCRDLSILHLTDSHYDPRYEVGANALCGAMNCCRKSQGKPADPKNGAGKWGDFRGCDSPWDAFINVLQQAKKAQKDMNTNYDYIYFTGDAVDHGAWDTSKPFVEESWRRTITAIRTYFPNVPLLILIGNHDIHPVNIWSPPGINRNISSQYFYDFLAESESKSSSLFNVDALRTIRAGGYYTVLLKPGLRVIALNNNDCFVDNFWLLYDPAFPGKQMQWLHDTLLEAERNGEKVHILAHIPNHDYQYFDVWARQYRKIVDRFWNTISAQFNGHTHYDEFNLFYSENNPNICVNVAFNGGSTTPYSSTNPNFKIYKVESCTFQVKDQYVWSYNLTDANQPSVLSPKWQQTYDFRKAYNLPNLSPANLDRLVDRFATDPATLKFYWQHKVKLGDPLLAKGCGSSCLISHVCQIFDTDASNNVRCNQISQAYNRTNKWV